MKKSLFLIMIGVVSFFGIKNVKAEEIYLEYETNINEVKPFIEEIGYDNLNIHINELINYYTKNYFDEYAYYHISVGSGFISLTLYNVLNYRESFSQSGTSFYYTPHGGQYTGQLFYNYDYSKESFSEIRVSFGSYSSFPIFEFFTSKYQYSPYNYYYSNYDFYYKGSLFEEYDDLNYLNPNDTLYIHSFQDPSLYSVHQANTDFLIEPYYLYDGNDSFQTEVSNYVTIDLNNYPYVALSLKDYNVEPFDSVMYVKGQLCPSGVYNYGMISKEDYKNGYHVTDRCNIAYDNFTPTKFYVSDNDLKNHSIWYLKAYDTSIENKIKVDSSVFNIHYITEEEKDNPILNINGKNYTTIPYDELPSTATKNEEENYVPGAVEEFTFEDFFDKPLEALKSVWNAIISVFAIITEFILLLPPTMQAFLYTSFGIAIVLGIIKILL